MIDIIIDHGTGAICEASVISLGNYRGDSKELAYSSLINIEANIEEDIEEDIEHETIHILLYNLYEGRKFKGIELGDIVTWLFDVIEYPTAVVEKKEIVPFKFSNYGLFKEHKECLKLYREFKNGGVKF